MKIIQSVLILILSLIGFSWGRPSENPEGQRLIQLSDSQPPQWMSPAQVHQLLEQNANFFDITDHPSPVNILSAPQPLDVPTTLRFGDQVRAAIPNLSIPRMTQFLTKFSEFYTRYYTTATGVEAADYLLSEVRAAILSSGYQGNVSANAFTHSWAQRSTVVRFEGANPASKDLVILGAHMDSIVGGGGTARSPGVDDNGTGSTCILEAFRALLEIGFVPEIALEFHWYAAEEVGLRGSQDIAAQYKRNGVNVVGMANFDMVGYNRASRIQIVTDFTDSTLSAFLRLLVEGYNSYPWFNNTCGYACSDHASWYREGYRAAIAHEDSTSPYLHTARDTLENIEFKHVQEYGKLALGFAIELAEPRTTTK